MADDLVDEPPQDLDASVWIQRLSEHLDLVYKSSHKKEMTPSQRQDLIRAYITASFPASARSALTYLPTTLLPPNPLYLLLEGFRTDSLFNPSPNTQKQQQPNQWPIADEAALRAYGTQVAGTVGELCLSLISHHSRTPILPPSRRDEIAAAAGRMGVALQYVNIARDIALDTTMGRVYLPQTWLAERGLVPEDVIARYSHYDGGKQKPKKDDGAEVEEELVRIRKEKLLQRAFAMYEEARPVMDLLPEEARRPMIVAVESYMEIGRVLLEQTERGLSISPGGMVRGRPTRATVPKMRRLKVALWQLLFA